MKIYVGAKYCERGAAKRLMAELVRQGHKITVDWTNYTKEDAESLTFYAQEDIRGVKQANVAIFIFENPHKYKGCWVEMGAALAKGRKVILIGKAGQSCVFVSHPKVMTISSMDNFLKLPLTSWLKGNRPAEEFIDSNPNWGKLEGCTEPVTVPHKLEPEVKS